MNQSFHLIPHGTPPLRFVFLYPSQPFKQVVKLMLTVKTRELEFHGVERVK